MNSKYNSETIKTVVQQYNEGTAVALLCTEHGVPRSTIYSWLKQHRILKSLTDSNVTYKDYHYLKRRMEKLEERLLEENINFYTLTGSTPKEDRIRLVDSFNVNDIPVFLISLRAGGTGLNLTGADIVIHYDPWWNVAVQNQATDRAHRIGQKQVVSVYRLLIKGTIEENIIRLQDKKRDLANQIFSGEGFGQGSFSKEELLELLS